MHLKDQNAVGVFLRQFFQFGGDHFAGAAPGREEVDNDQLVTCILQFAVKVFLKKLNSPAITIMYSSMNIFTR